MTSRETRVILGIWSIWIVLVLCLWLVDGHPLVDSMAYSLQHFALKNVSGHTKMGLGLYTTFIILALMAIVTLTALFATWFMVWRKAAENGSLSYKSMRRHIIITTPVDWDKMWAFLEVLKELRYEFLRKIVVVSEGSQLEALPPKLKKEGVRFVRGSTSDRETLIERTGAKRALGVMIAAPGYDKPKVADGGTIGIGADFEQERDELVTAAEIVLESSLRRVSVPGLYEIDTHTCVDLLSMQAAVDAAKKAVAGDLSKTVAFTTPIDDDQRQTLVRMLQEAELNVVGADVPINEMSEEGNVNARESADVLMILPSTLDAPGDSDDICFGEAIDGMVRGQTVVPMYLSVRADYRFRRFKHAICFDRITTRHLVWAFIDKLVEKGLVRERRPQEYRTSIAA